MDRAKTIKVTLVMVIIVALIIGYYVYLTSKNNDAASRRALEKNVEAEMTPVQELIARAKYKEYPATPVQVVKYYNEITRCYYNETYTDEELESLARLTRGLFDDELVANQTEADYFNKLKIDIQNFKNNNITIYSEEVSSTTDVEYFDHNGYECARLYCTYPLKSGTSYMPSKQVFILRKDQEGHWKIFGFDITKE